MPKEARKGPHMFDKILIANRGEIACRVIDTCRRLGVRTVAVHSDVDAQARHVEMADVAVSLGGASPAESYLRGDAIIAAAQATGAQAIHPGYGFLSENPDFVDAVEAAGLVFIGPSAKAIRAMGLKDAAKALMAEAGVPVVPGYHGEDQDPGHLEVEAAAIGYPVLIKAVAGGGGKGMRLVERAEAFVSGLESAKAEARGAFGNDAVLIEKYITSPRHIEVQVFGDGQTAVHLFERDCSLQRRHQKVIEEAPAPGMTPEMRDAMGQAAVRAAEAIGYKGAGTVEFIVDGSDGLRPDGFWFMEMNTRLQVEHPVTEAITGVDLVEWQVRVAAGEPLPCAQEDLQITGHSFEARLYAEDVPAGFLPATGTLSHLAFPDDVRADTGVRAGDTISPHYDPMIAKVIVHAATRDQALARLRRALQTTEVGGTVTNIGFLAALAGHDGFMRGDVDTDLIARDLATLTRMAEPHPAAIAQAVMALLRLDGPPRALDGFALWQALTQTCAVRVGGADLTVAVTVHAPGRIDVTWGDQTVEARFGTAAWRYDGQAERPVVTEGTKATVFGADACEVVLTDPLQVDAASGQNSDLVEAPMPGLVRDVFVSAGKQVARGDRLVILEAMKMEHTLSAARDGIVAEVMTHPGDQVSAGAALIRLEEAEA